MIPDWFLIAKDVGLGIVAAGLGVVAVVNGKDKVDRNVCEKHREQTQKEFSAGEIKFTEIKGELKNIKEIVTEIKDRLDK